MRTRHKTAIKTRARHRCGAGAQHIDAHARAARGALLASMRARGSRQWCCCFLLGSWSHTSASNSAVSLICRQAYKAPAPQRLRGPTAPQQQPPPPPSQRRSCRLVQNSVSIFIISLSFIVCTNVLTCCLASSPTPPSCHRRRRRLCEVCRELVMSQ